MSFCLTYPSAVFAGERTPSFGRFARAAMSADLAAETPEERHAEDARLMRRMSGGEKAAFALLYDRFSKPLYSMALHVLHEPAEAQDVVHDAFVALWEKAADFDPSKGNAFSWAVTLTRNRAIDRLRQSRRRSQLLSESSADAMLLHEGGAQPDAERSAETSDDATHVRAAVGTLPREQRHAVELAFFKGLTQQQIADSLKEPLGTVKARIRRGLLKLREELSRRL